MFALIIGGLSQAMGKKLIIAEKPSVANDIARALGRFTRKGDYFESDDYVLSSAVGHLLELAVPDEYEVKRGKWSFKHLPVIPPRFELSPLEKSEQRLNLLLRLMKRKDVTALVNACDAGREGELIFRYIVQHARVKRRSKPSRRKPAGRSTRASPPRRASIRGAGSILSSRRTTIPSARPSACGTKSAPPRSSVLARERRASRRRRASLRRSSPP